MILYNSLGQTKQEFVPYSDKQVNMYTCGPTVYHYAHIGNLRTYIMEDVLEKYLRFAGYNVNQSKIAIGSGGIMGKGFLNGFT